MAIDYLQILLIPVSDQEKAKRFYVDILGWDLLSDESYSTPQGNLRWLEVRPKKGQTAISLIPDDETRKAGSMDNMTLHTDNLESTVEELTHSGVSFEHEIRMTPMGKYTRFRDPDGNVWTLQEIKKGLISK
jgi:predicted enzyme related to lactoylglutathione lyase